MWKFLCSRRLILRFYTTGRSVCGGARASITVKFAKKAIAIKVTCSDLKLVHLQYLHLPI